MTEATHTIQESGTDAAIDNDGQVVVFRLANEEFGVDINNVREIVRLPNITPIPRSPEYVAGICNLRGNVLPVINTRCRFSMETDTTTDHTRLLVVETKGVQTSLIVDSVREVMRLTDAHIEPPPPVCRNVERQFLSGVIKVNSGQRLILMLNLNEILSIDEDDVAETGAAVQTDDAVAVATAAVSEEQLVSFKLAGDEYAFDISKVREILKITEITAVPNVPDYVRGLFTIRNHLLPIIDLRGLLGMSALVSEKHDYLDKGLDEDRLWVGRFKNIVETESSYSGNLNAKETPFGQWLEQYKTTSAEIEGVIKRIKKVREKLYWSCGQVLQQITRDKDAALAGLTENIPLLLKIVEDTVNEFRQKLIRHICEDQRALVVEIQGVTVGFLVDWVDEVIRIPHSIIDETPMIAASERRELKAVAKMDNGSRLIMIMDENALVSVETSRMISDMKQTDDKSYEMATDQKSLAQQSMDEEQLVTFNINREEYGVRIMQVQEINRATEITSVPRAPQFVDGMTNLRGSVIPVINIRSLFGLEDRNIDDRTRIIIVDINNKKTGLRVDEVNEVLRLSKHDIMPTPKIVMAGGLNKYMEGVCKIDAGKRMVVLLNIEKILDENELEDLNAITGADRKPKRQSDKSFSDKQKAVQDAGDKKSSKKKKLEIAE